MLQNIIKHKKLDVDIIENIQVSNKIILRIFKVKNITVVVILKIVRTLSCSYYINKYK